MGSSELLRPTLNSLRQVFAFEPVRLPLPVGVSGIAVFENLVFIRGKRQDLTPKTHSDRATAEMVAAVVMAERQADIQRWLNDPKSARTMEFDSATPFNKPIGEGVPKGTEQAQDLSKGRVVLRKDPNSPEGYFILTSYPIE